MFKVVVPIPDPANLELSTIIELTLFLIFFFATGFSFLSVVITETVPASVAVLKLRILSDFPPLLNTNLSAVSSSVVPSDLKTAYLSASNGKKVSFSPASKVVAILLFAMVLVNTFLMEIEASVKSTLDIFSFGNTVYNLFSELGSKLVVIILKSETSVADDGNDPLATPDTFATPVIVMVVLPTPVTLATMGSTSEDAKSVYSTRSFIFTNSPVPGNS